MTSAGVANYSLRFLKIVASLVAKGDVTVILSQRTRKAAIVAFEAWTIVLDERRAGLLDLCLAACVLRWRAEVKEFGEGDKSIPRRVARALIRRARSSLLEQYPGIMQLEGTFRSAEPTSWPGLVWRKVRWTPLAPGEFGAGGRSTRWQTHTTVEVTGPNDLRRFLMAVESGQVQPTYYPEMPGLPVVSIPYSITSAGEPSVEFERFERDIKANRELVEGLRTCYIRKSESQLPERLRGRRTTTGLILDTQRLVEAEIGRRTGLPPRIFRRPDEESQPLFDPKRHLVLCAFNANGLHKNDQETRAFSYRALGIFFEAFKSLGVNLVVQAFSDHLVRLRDGRQVYAQLFTDLKGFKDKIDASFYNRFIQLLQAPVRLPAGTACCFPPLMVRCAQAEFERINGFESHDYHTLCLVAKGRMLPGAEFNTKVFLGRATDALDARLKEIREKLPGIFDSMFCFIPEALKHAAKTCGDVAKMY